VSQSTAEVTDQTRTNLVRLLRVAYPHAQFPDGPYERTADTILAQLDSDLWHKIVLVEGLTTLDAAAVSRGAASFVELDDTAALTLLEEIADAEFFTFVRGVAIVTLYDDREVWELLGYEGSSYDKGGYINRGFDDLDWLPEIRVTEYDGPEQLVEVADADQPTGA